MRLSIPKVFILLIASTVLYGWQSLSRTSHETVVLTIPDTGNRDTYVTLWVVEDRQHLWLRAENPQRHWLKYLEGGRVVKLQRRGETRSYTANLYDDSKSQADVDSMFRAKYGLADELRGMMKQRDTVPIRLESE